MIQATYTIVEWPVLVIALLMEAANLTWPGYQAQVLKGKRPAIWSLLFILTGLLFSVLYFIYTITWFFTDRQPYILCGGIMVALSLTARMKHSDFMRSLDSAICFVCLFLIAYARMKGF